MSFPLVNGGVAIAFVSVGGNNGDNSSGRPSSRFGDGNVGDNSLGMGLDVSSFADPDSSSASGDSESLLRFAGRGESSSILLQRNGELFPSSCDTGLSFSAFGVGLSVSGRVTSILGLIVPFLFCDKTIKESALSGPGFGDALC